MSSEPFLQSSHRHTTAGHSCQPWGHQAEHWPTTQPHHPATCCVRQVKCFKHIGGGACCSCCALARQGSKHSKITMCHTTKPTPHPHPLATHRQPACWLRHGRPGVQQLQADAAHHTVNTGVASSCACLLSGPLKHASCWCCWCCCWRRPLLLQPCPVPAALPPLRVPLAPRPACSQ